MQLDELKVGNMKALAKNVGLFCLCAFLLALIGDHTTGWVLLLLPLLIIIHFLRKEYKCRNKIVLRFFLVPLINTIIVLCVAIVAFGFTGRYLSGESLFTVSVIAALMLFSWVLKKITFVFDEKNMYFESYDLTVAYNKCNRELTVKSKNINSTQKIPGGFSFSFVKSKQNISTDTTVARTSRGDSIRILGTGSYEKTSFSTALYIQDNLTEPHKIYYSYSVMNSFYLKDRKPELIIWSGFEKKLSQMLGSIQSILDAEVSEINKKEKAEKDLIAAEQKQISDLAQKALKNDALKNARLQCDRLLEDWGIDPNSSFNTYRYLEKDGGYICTMLAADKNGQGGAVLNDGKDTWSGSWKNAQVKEAGDTLEIQIDDAEYREKNLKERRFVINYLNRDERVEWIDRIRILSAHA